MRLLSNKLINQKTILGIVLVLIINIFLLPVSAVDGFGDGMGMPGPGGGGGCGDLVAPILTSTSPLDNSSGVSVSSNLILGFDETVSCVATKNLSIYKTSDYSLVTTIDVTDGQVTGCDTSSITVDPSSDLLNSTSYYIQIDSGAFKDACNNNYAGIADQITWNFTTAAGADVTAPTVTSFSPADNSIGVSGTANLVITFSENVQKNSGNIVIKRVSDGLTLETISITSLDVTVSGTSVTINPTTTLPSGTAVYVEIESGAIEDLAGNDYAGITGSTTWKFTIADTGAPSVMSFSPADNSTGVSVNSNLVINFSENVTAVDGSSPLGNELVNPQPKKIDIKRSDNNATLETIYTNSNRLTGSGTSTITIDPINPLPNETSIYITIESGAFKDASNNNYAGINDSTTWNFTTADTTAPTLTSLSPANNATNVLLETNLVMTFSENVQAGTGNITIKKSSDNSPVQTISITNPAVNFSGNQVTINPPSDLLASTSYYINIASTTITDASGNAYAGILDSSSWNFTTAGYPEVTGTIPPVNEPVYSLTEAKTVFSIPIVLTPGSTFLECRAQSQSGPVVYSRPLTEASIGSSSNILNLPPLTDLFYNMPGLKAVCNINNNNAIKSENNIVNPDGYNFDLFSPPAPLLP